MINQADLRHPAFHCSRSGLRPTVDTKGYYSGNHIKKPEVHLHELPVLYQLYCRDITSCRPFRLQALQEQLPSQESRRWHIQW